MKKRRWRKPAGLAAAWRQAANAQLNPLDNGQIMTQLKKAAINTIVMYA